MVEIKRISLPEVPVRISEPEMVYVDVALKVRPELAVVSVKLTMLEPSSKVTVPVVLTSILLKDDPLVRTDLLPLPSSVTVDVPALKVPP